MLLLCLASAAPAGGIPRADRFVTLAAPDSSAAGPPFRFEEPGFHGLVGPDGRGYSVFVSPVPSKHVREVEDYDWYVPQFNGDEAFPLLEGWPTADVVVKSNCGPAIAAMGIAWATGRRFSAADIRMEMGWRGDGGTTFDEIAAVMKKHGAASAIQALSAPGDIFAVIDEGRLAVIVFHTSGISPCRGDPAKDVFGRYTDILDGHYVVIKGYSLDHAYLVAYDPMPADWETNSVRCGDGVSMIGKNRYYSVKELFACLRGPRMLVIR